MPASANPVPMSSTRGRAGGAAAGRPIESSAMTSVMPRPFGASFESSSGVADVDGERDRIGGPFERLAVPGIDGVLARVRDASDTARLMTKMTTASATSIPPTNDTALSASTPSRTVPSEPRRSSNSPEIRSGSASAKTTDEQQQAVTTPSPSFRGLVSTCGHQ